MAKYFFEAISPERALAYDPSVDSLGFFTNGAAPNRLSVAFNADGTVSVTLSGTTVVFGSKFTGDVNFDFGAGSARFVIGTPGADVITGGSGFGGFGGSGDDTLVSGAGADLLDGGAGVDTLQLGSINGALIADLASGGAFALDNPSAQDILRGVENVTGGAFDDRLLGDAAGNAIRGAAGADTLNGREGADTLDGGVGADSVDGGDGDDVIVVSDRDVITGGAGGDTFQLAPTGAPITGDVAAVPRIVDFTAADRLVVVGGPPVTAGNLVVISAATYGEALAAARGQYALGAQYIAATVGGSTYVFAPLTEQVVQLSGVTGLTPTQIAGSGVAPGGDASYTGGAGDDAIVGDRGAGVLNGAAGADTLTAVSPGAFTLQGGTGDDRLAGGVFGDNLQGGDGADSLEGGLGPDTLAGGAGADLFLWTVDQASTDAGLPDVIVDWSAQDRLSFGGGKLTIPSYRELSASDPSVASTLAGEAIRSGQSNFVVVAVGADLLVFADGPNNNTATPDVVRIVGRTLDDIDGANFALAEGGPELPPPPSQGAVLTPTVNVTGNMDLFQIGRFVGATVSEAGPTQGFFVSNPRGAVAIVTGQGLTYDPDNLPAGGTITAASLEDTGVRIALQTSPISGGPFSGWVKSNATTEALGSLLAGGDIVRGSDGADLIRGFAGGDTIQGAQGANTIFGGLGDDYIIGGLRPGEAGASTGNYLRGDEGADYVMGSDGFDDINGNMGDDTASGGLGDDWVVGGKENDRLYGGEGGDLVYGNLGADTCQGGAGADTIRGGQDSDYCFGDAGDDFVSGDKGSDTMTGGAGADIFHTFGDAGIDRVTDFNLAQGDRVMLDPGTKFTVAQVGADTVIDMTGGGQMILVGVAMSSLTGDWIFGA